MPLIIIKRQNIYSLFNMKVNNENNVSIKYIYKVVEKNELRT